MKKDFSIHFTIKGQELATIEKAFHKFMNGHPLLNEENFGVRSHTCQLPRKVVEEKGFNLGIIEFIESLTDGNDVNWFFACATLEMSRNQMLETIKRLDGVSIFVGEIRDGVAEEYKTAKELGIETIEIPLWILNEGVKHGSA